MTGFDTAPPVWVLDDPRAGASDQVIGIAERLGVPFRIVPVSWNWMANMAALSRRGTLLGLVGATPRDDPPAPAPVPWPFSAETGPKLVIAAGSRSASVALWLRNRFGAAIVQAARAPFFPALGSRLRLAPFDLVVVPRHDSPPSGDAVFPTIGTPHRVSPIVLQTARSSWAERLAHLPSPRIALLLGGAARGAGMPAALAHNLAAAVARIAASQGGCVLAITSHRTGQAATDGAAAALGPVMHLLYRWGEPGDNPYLGFLAHADAIVGTADSMSTVSEACATTAPVFVALPELAGGRHRRFHNSLFRAGHARPFQDDISPWPHTPLDEAGRVAAEIHRRLALD